MRILVCGSSKFRDRVAMYRTLDKLHDDQSISLITNGGARGADYLSSQWAKERGVPLKVHKADWKTHGEEAVFILNGVMLSEMPPDKVLAFPGGDVTADMVRLADQAGIEVIKIHPQQ